MKKTKKTPQRKTTLKWNVNGELSSIDMARVLEALSVKELSECELSCNTELKKLNLSMWWQIVFAVIKERGINPLSYKKIKI